MAAVDNLSATAGTVGACEALGVPRASYYRCRRPRPVPSPRPRPQRALSDDERRQITEVLHSEDFADLAVPEVFARLLDQGRYFCSPRTMYRILAANGEARERRDVLRHPAYAKPELLATRPNEVWSWDITKLRGPAKWTYFYLYVVLDLFSRYVVGWLLAQRESAALAERLIAETCMKEQIKPGELTLHADRGSSMTAKPLALLLSDLSVTKTHSRPHVPDDNPFSESQFKTMKYRPGFPERFQSIEHGRHFSRDFFHWYNHEHRHSGIAMLTPAMVHHDRATGVLDARHSVLANAYAARPERFVHGLPKPQALPAAVWINPPAPDKEAAQ